MRRDIGVTRFLRDFLPEWTTTILLGVTLLGDLVVIIPLLGLLYAADVGSTLRDRSEPPLCSDRTAVLIALVLGGLSLIVVLESVFALPRPPAELHAVTPNTHGFPSGHTMAATVFWGATAILVPHSNRSTRITIAGFVVFLVAFSRLALGVHYLPDVIAGILFGVIYLALAAWIAQENPFRAFWMAIAISVIAVVVTTANPRGLLALIGTIGGAIGWWIFERSRVQHWLITLTGR